MEKILTLGQIADACKGRLVNADSEILATDIITDSRKVTDGAIFVALRGEKFDGHNFVAQSIAAGAACCIVDKAYKNSNNLPVIEVEDTYAALRDSATFYRSRFSLPSVGITGSVGKTSTKDMVASVLGVHYNVLKTEGNFNNEIGLPLTAFRLNNENEIAVFEMGMSAFGEISRLTKIAAPDTAIITNIGYSHIEHLGSRENILKAKLEILEGLAPGGTVILNGDDEYLRDVIGTLPFETLSYGIENKNCDIVAENIKKYHDHTVFDVNVDGETVCLRVNVPGLHHVYNALAAVLIGVIYNIPIAEIVEGVESFKPSGMRQNIVRTKNFAVIKDCYNASPTSMKSGLEVLSVTKPNDKELPCRRIAVLGDMLELGDFSEEAHKSVGGLCCEYSLDCLIAVGKNAKFVTQGAIENGFNSSELYVFYDNNAVKEHISDILKPNDVILFKGSRGMRLEEIADFLLEKDEAE